MTLHLCQSGYEAFLIKELGGNVEKSGPGWVLGPDGAGELCFAHLSLKAPVEVEGKSLNALAGAMADYFTSSTKDERFEGPWPFCVESAGDTGLSRRAKTAAEECYATVKGRMSRVAKLAVQGRPGPGPARGFFAYLPGFDRAYVARDAVAGGQKRMADDPQAPSRSYLKVEEAYGLLGREPVAGETVADLGAAPGGWSYSAAKRGALVVAVDNGPLKGGAIHAGITHKAEDAFKFAPEPGVDWLFCDMVEDPDRITDLLEAWLDRGWCKRFIVNLKFGRNDPLRVLSGAEKLRSKCALLRVRHLFHDREELTLVGERAV
ncbi:MAG: SAM-dependent methyltransferase [Elusimicrobiota bacterium]